MQRIYVVFFQAEKIKKKTIEKFLFPIYHLGCDWIAPTRKLPKRYTDAHWFAIVFGRKTTTGPDVIGNWVGSAKPILFTSLSSSLFLFQARNDIEIASSRFSKERRQFSGIFFLPTWTTFSIFFSLFILLYFCFVSHFAIDLCKLKMTHRKRVNERKKKLSFESISCFFYAS